VALVADVQTERITIEEALAFLRSALPSVNCRVCHADDLEPIVEHDKVHVAQMRLHSGVTSFYPAVAFICRRCGDISQFSWPTIKDWLDTRQAKS
jgi:ribosomal protein L40E